MTLSPQNAQAQLGARINWLGRPILFTKSDGSVTVECTYDTMGRRATKKVTTNGTLTEHRRFLYRGYLQIACCDLTRAYTPALWFILWDPTQPTATRPLAIQKNGTWYTYGWDLTKNICETYRTDGCIDLAYTYTPYGEVSPAHAYDQPLHWSSEYHDVELGLVYYNYRHYNPVMGRWMGRDHVHSQLSSGNLYDYIYNNVCCNLDLLGLLSCSYLSAGGMNEPHGIHERNGTTTPSQEAFHSTLIIGNIIISELSYLNKEYALLTRAEGVTLALAGVGEVALGVVAFDTPEISSSVIGAMMVAHGVDVISTGVKVLYTGKLHSTTTHRVITETAVAAGADQNTAAVIASSAEIAIGGKAVFASPMTNCTKALNVEMTGVRYTVVSRWGDELTPGKWVMKGKPTVWNYLMSGKYQPKFTNEFAWPWQVNSYKVPYNTLKNADEYPKIFKTFIGQRIYKP